MIVTLDETYSPSGRNTYHAATGPFTPPATPTDVFTVVGAAGKLVRVMRLWIVTYQTTAGFNNWFLKKKSAANTAGTAVASTKIPTDSTFAAATATVQHYTANPTIGTEIGNLWAGLIPSPALATATMDYPMFFIDFVEKYGNPIILRGTAQAISWNFNGAALPGGLAVNCGVTWTEDSK